MGKTLVGGIATAYLYGAGMGVLADVCLGMTKTLHGASKNALKRALDA
jgi:hypothetical protein